MSTNSNFKFNGRKLSSSQQKSYKYNSPALKTFILSKDRLLYIKSSSESKVTHFKFTSAARTEIASRFPATSTTGSTLSALGDRNEVLLRECLDKHQDFVYQPNILVYDMSLKDAELKEVNLKMGDEEQATLDGQFYEFSKLLDNKRSGLTITLYRSDYWMRQAKLLEDRKLTMTETGLLFNKFSKSELNWDEWLEFLSDLCQLKGYDEEMIKDNLTNCGIPGQNPVVVPQYRDFFLTYKPKEKMLF